MAPPARDDGDGARAVKRRYEIDLDCDPARVSIDDPAVHAVLADPSPNAESLLTAEDDNDSARKYKLTLRLRSAVRFLPPDDRLLLLAAQDARQIDLARERGVTHEAISLRLARAVRKVRFVLSLPSLLLPPAKVAAALVPALAPDDVVLLSTLFVLAFSLPAASRALSVPRALVLSRLRRLPPELTAARDPVPRQVGRDLARILSERAWWLGSSEGAYVRAGAPSTR